MKTVNLTNYGVTCPCSWCYNRLIETMWLLLLVGERDFCFEPMSESACLLLNNFLDEFNEIGFPHSGSVSKEKWTIYFGDI